MPDSPIRLEALRQDALAIALRHAPSDGLHDGRVPGLQLIRASMPAQPLPAVYEPGLVLVLQGRKQATLGAEVLHYDPLHCLLVAVTLLPVGQITEASVDQPYLCLRLQTSPTELAALLLEAGQPAAPTAAEDGLTCALNLAPVSESLLDAAVRLLRLLDEPQDVPVLAPLLQREVFYRVLTGPLGPRLRALAQSDSQTRRIARAIELLRQRYDQPLRVEELAAVAHMSASTLHLHFKQLTALSPLQYQKHLRLHHARRLMLAEGLDAARAAIQVGYESPSQFSREYRRLFGSPPRADVTRVKTGSAVS
ncbi:MAG: AraC family transcriptional regulator [Aquabacterium sp.]|uniref:AraC family transcriptional regulator n=1 Tax=Aquabacterium sp. TaxID=1872578 RepID=UPI001214DA1D|nr:AraC family transcriptional regulator [Aquabacterium sp.]TAK97239.1 MAG: AraC family transcriptional regulator [Aquabacterium sp.]